MKSLRTVVGLAALTLGWCRLAGAQTAEAEAEERVSPAIALAWSLGGTAVPVATGLLLRDDGGWVGPTLIFTGVLIGPSAGHFYSGESGRGLAWIGGRLLSGGMIWVGAVTVLSTSIGCIFEQEDCSGWTPGETIIVTGLGFLAATTVGGIVDGCLSAERANRRQVQLMPLVRTGTETSLGLTLAGTF